MQSMHFSGRHGCYLENEIHKKNISGVEKVEKRLDDAQVLLQIYGIAL